MVAAGIVAGFIFILISSFQTHLPSSAAQLPLDEVEALRLIGEKLGKKDWNFSVDPCNRTHGLITPGNDRFSNSTIDCDCTFPDNICHVVSIILKTQNLDGVLPAEIVRLPYLKQIDFTRNYLSGQIPAGWGSTKLVEINLLGNRLTGGIPREIGNISTLEVLVLETNQLSGTIPESLGTLPRLRRLHLTSNYFSGTLPLSLGMLTSLEEFRINDNNFSGPIPSFISNWRNLTELFIQASGLSGPIPSDIGLLTNLDNLRISDLNGSASSPFPFLDNMSKIERVIMRSCNIIGELPNYLHEMTSVKILDLSFNKITGQISNSFLVTPKIDDIYLTGNFLSGPVPESILGLSERRIDLSYNNFTVKNLDICSSRTLNLFSPANYFGDQPCANVFSCSKESKSVYSLHINCGGSQKTINGSTIFEDDIDSGSASTVFRSLTNWAFSSTGNFMDDADSQDTFVVNNIPGAVSMENVNPELSELFMNARRSALSLTYYALCMANGNYTVNLYFAEIMFTNDTTYRSLGRRIFDVYIQGDRVLQDFNIAERAGGAHKAVIIPFKRVTVTNGTLEIRFHWAGKGTNNIPGRGDYGPLISAISIDSDIKPPPEDVERPPNAISAGAVVGIVAATTFFIFSVLSILWWRGCLGKERTLEQELKGIDLATGSYTLRQIKVATNNFAAENKIGEGGFGPVYKGVMADGTVIAVKQLSSKSKQGNREFVNEIGMISALQHPHLVKLYGCCIEGNQLLLVYEYMENNSLARVLFGPKECQLKLEWPTRHKICVGIARGLAYLHEESTLKIVHRDIKATNVLLDKNLNPKISDFGLAKLDEEENTHISTRIAGTFGYMAPEYAMRGYLTDKADVYSFGIVALEIVSGLSNTSYRSKDDCFYLLDWAHGLKEKGSLMELVDPRLGREYEKEAMTMINIALQCTNVVAAERPTMSSVVSMLEGKVVVKEIVSNPSIPKQDMNAMWARIHRREDQTTSESQTQSMLFDGSSSTSFSDLYPLTVNSKYLEDRR